MKSIFVVLLMCLAFTSVQANPIAPTPKEIQAEKEYEAKARECPADKPLWDERECHACDTAKTVKRPKFDTKIYECEKKCPNRRDGWRIGCILKVCPQGYIKNPDYHNLSINNFKTCITNDEYLKVYEVGRAKCPKDKPLWDYKTFDIPNYGTKWNKSRECLACDVTQRINDPLGYECEKCPNRDLSDNNGFRFCILKKCPQGFKRHYNHGECIKDK